MGKGDAHGQVLPDGTFKLTSVANLREKKIVMFMWCSNDMFHYVFKAGFVKAHKFKSPVGFFLLL